MAANKASKDQTNNQPQEKNNQITCYGMMPSSSSSSSSALPQGNFIMKDGGVYDLGELDQALFLYMDNPHSSSSAAQDGRQDSGMRPPTLNIFPSKPMHVEPSSSKDNNIRLSSDTNGPKKPSDPSMNFVKPEEQEAKSSKPRKATSEHDSPKTPDPKTLRRLAQNREAARKSRLRKKAYVQQLESSRVRLTQLEQELQRVRSQGMVCGGGGHLGVEQGHPMGPISAEAAVFNSEYGRWLEEQHRIMMELRAALEEQLPETELRLYVENGLAHFDEIINLKSMIAKSDVFHLVSGTWLTPAERCFMWIGGFRPSELLRVILNQTEPLTEQQFMSICSLRQSTQEAEDALTQGMEALNQSLSETISTDSLSSPPNMGSYMGQMAVALNKLAALEGFVRQADNLRHQTYHRLHQLLTVRQSAKCLLAISEYFQRLRALSSLWLIRPRSE